MHFCEALTRGPIAQPANAFSSLAFVAVGARLRRDDPRRSVMTLFPVSAVLVGITSFLYHASWTFFFQVFDVSSMFVLSCLLLSFNAWRLGLVARAGLPWAYAAAWALSTAAMLVLRGRSGEWLFAVEVTAVLASEVVLARRRPGTDYRAYGTAAALFFAAFGIWILDAREVVCAPENHWLQGHAAWHLLDADCFVALSRFYAQFAD